MRHDLIRSYLILGLIIAIETIVLVRLQQPAPEIAQHAGLQHDEGPKGFVGDPAVALATLLLAAFTFGLYWATRSLGIATQELVRDANRTAEMQLRAYVLVESAEVRPTSNFDFVVTIFVKNFGRTPASQVTPYIRSAVCRRPARSMRPAEIRNAETEVRPPFVSGPDMRTEVALTIYGLTNSDFDGPRLGHPRSDALTVFVDGVIHYVDAFQAARRTTFCLYLRHDEQGQRMVPWSVGNDAT